MLPAVAVAAGPESVKVYVASDQTTVTIEVNDAPLVEIIEEVSGRLGVIVKGRPSRASEPLVSYRQRGILPDVLRRLLRNQNYVLSSCERPRLDVCREQIHFLDSATREENPLEKTASALPVVLPQLDVHHSDDTGDVESRQKTNYRDDEDESNEVASILKQRAGVMRRPRTPVNGGSPAVAAGDNQSLTNNQEEPVAIEPQVIANDPNIRRRLQETTRQATSQLNALVDGLQKAGDELALSQ